MFNKIRTTNENDEYRHDCHNCCVAEWCTFYSACLAFLIESPFFPLFPLIPTCAVRIIVAHLMYHDFNSFQHKRQMLGRNKL